MIDNLAAFDEDFLAGALVMQTLVIFSNTFLNLESGEFTAFSVAIGAVYAILWRWWMEVDSYPEWESLEVGG